MSLNQNHRSKSMINLPHSLEDERTIKLVSLGLLDITLTLKLPSSFYTTNKINFENINSIDDLDFLSSNRNLWNDISLSSESQSINFLLQLNRSTIEKIFISYICLKTICISEKKNEFIIELINYIAEKNWIFLNYEDIFTDDNQENNNDGMHITFNLYKDEEELKSILIVGTEGEIFEEETQKEDNKDNEEYNTNNNQNSNGNNKNDNKEDKKENLLLKLTETSYNEFNYILFNLQTLLLENKFLQKNISIENISEFYTYLKVNYSLIGIITYFTNFLSQIQTIEHVNCLFTLVDLTDYYLFEKKDAHSLLNFIHIIKHKELKENSNNYTISNTHLTNLDKRKIISFFTNNLFEQNPYQQKLAIFMDDFNRVTIVHYNPSKSLWQTYDYDTLIYPKINHHNISTIKEYKNLVKINYHSFLLIFFGSFIGKLIQMQNGLILTRYIYISYLIAVESAKKILEIFKNKLPKPSNPKYYIVKLSNHKINSYFKEQKTLQQENKFKLDCLNKKRSQLKFYNSLFDNHLKGYFNSWFNKKELILKGFINSQGYIMYDALYRDLLGNIGKLKGEINDKTLLKYIHRLNVGDDIKNKEINVLDNVKKMNISTKKKLPNYKMDNSLLTTNLSFNQSSSLPPIKNRNKNLNLINRSCLLNKAPHLNDSQVSQVNDYVKSFAFDKEENNNKK